MLLILGASCAKRAKAKHKVVSNELMMMILESLFKDKNDFDCELGLTYLTQQQKQQWKTTVLLIAV